MMATCKDCFHNEACVDMLELMGYIVNGDGIDADKRCNQFINASDVAPVVPGWWVRVDSSYYRWTPSGGTLVDCATYRCSRCGRGTAVKSNYCHNCGAKMDGEDEPK